MAIERVAEVDAAATAQHGLMTSGQAREALGPSRKHRWVSEGRLISVQPGVLRLAGAPPTWHQSLMAAALATGGIVSHRSAAELWGLIQPAGYVEVSIKAPRQSRLRPPAIAHRSLDPHPELAVERTGLAITDPVRTVIDLGVVLPRRAVSDALGRGISTRLLRVSEVDLLRDALGRQGRNSTGVMREILEERPLIGDAASALEKRFKDLSARHGLPQPALQLEVWEGGRFVARVDAGYPDRLLAIEVDGFEPPSTPEALQHDPTRQNRLVALGWTVLRFTWTDVTKRPGMVAATIIDAMNRLPAA